MVSENKSDDNCFESLIYIQTSISVFNGRVDNSAMNSDLVKVLSNIFEVNPITVRNIFIIRSVLLKGGTCAL